MRIRIMSREEAEDATPDLCRAVVSITDPGSNPAALKRGWFRVLALQFHDLDVDKLRRYYSDETIVSMTEGYPLMTPEHAAEIVSFVDAVKRAGVTGIVCHCEAGISRSAAVAKWIAWHYHLPPLGPAVYAHNRYVYRLLCEAAKRSRP